MSTAAATVRLGPVPIRRLPPRVVLTIVLLVWAVGEAIGLDGSWPLAARVVFVVVVLAPIVVIDRWPWAVAAILLAGTAVEVSQDVLAQSVSPMQGIVIAGWVAGATVTTRWRSIAALALVTGIALVATAGLGLFGVTMACVLGWAGARATLGVRRRRADALEILQTARRTSAELRRSEVEAERRRLARELDVAVLRAARRIGANAARADALMSSDPHAAAAVLRTIAGAVREAMGQMREALAVLRSDDGDDAGSPQPDGLGTAIAALRDRGVAIAVRDRGDVDDRATALATARILEIVARSTWMPGRIDLQRDRYGGRIRLRGHGPVTADERLALTRSAERARLHGGTVRFHRRPRPWDLRGRTMTVRIPVPTGVPRRGPGPAGFVAGLVAAAATAVDVVTGHSLPIVPGTEPTVTAILASSALTGLAVTLAWTQRTAFLVLLAFVAFLRGWIVNFVGLDATTLPLLACIAFVTPLWLRDARSRWLVAAALALTSAAIVSWAWKSETNGSDVAIIATSIGVPWVIATAVREAADETARLTVLRWSTARDDLIAAQQAVDDERRRVARDLHDMVGHGLSLVSIQAWGAERALPHDVPRAREGIVAIRRVVSGAVGELEQLVTPWGDELDDPRRSVSGEPSGSDDGSGKHRAAVGGLGGASQSGGAAGAAALTTPAPHEPQIADVVAEAQRSGLPVTLDADVAPGGADDMLPTPIATALRRVVQESLTNVVRHAGPVPTTVRLRTDATTITVEITNPLGRPRTAPEPSSGLGILGMHERIDALGGTFSAEKAASGFVVRATVPLPAPKVPLETRNARR